METSPKKNVRLERIGLATIGVALLLLGIGLFWIVYPYDVTSVKEPILILNENNEIPIGGNIELQLEVNKVNDLIPEVTIFIECDDGSLLPLVPFASVNLPRGEFTVVNDDYVVPNGAAVGSICTFNFRNTYQVNPIRSITREWASEEFLVLEQELDGD
jgi:hypothetical protein